MNSTLSTLALMVNQDKSGHREALERVRSWAVTHDVHLVDAACCGLEGIPPKAGEDWEAIDALLVLGGDGTMLGAARLLAGSPVPVLGVNLGHLGFMTAVRVEDIETALDHLRAGDFRIGERLMARCSFPDRPELPAITALNEVVLGWGDNARIATIRLWIDDEEVNTFRCDGMIISTPTGSTGHSLSAMGPIVHPDAPSLLLNIVCPQSLSARPVVLPGDARCVLEVDAGSKEMVLSIDGTVQDRIPPGHRIQVDRSDATLNLIELSDYSYFSLIREKLNWRGFHLA